MIPIPPFALKYGAYALILGATYISGCVRGSQTANARTEQVKADYLQFRVNTEAIGKAAQKEANATKAANEQKAKASDESYAKALVVLGRDIGELRRARTSTDYLPPAPADTKCPEGWVCFDRAALESAIRQLDEGVSGIVEKSDTVRLRMDESIKWANRLNQ